MGKGVERDRKTEAKRAGSSKNAAETAREGIGTYATSISCSRRERGNRYLQMLALSL